MATEIDNYIEEIVRNFSACSILQSDQRKADLIPWKPQICLDYIDYAGPFHCFYYLIIVDSYSKWIGEFKTENPYEHFILNHL